MPRNSKVNAILLRLLNFLGEMMYQRQYWNEMQELRAHVNYLELYQLKCESWERGINIALAVASSSSIGGWVVWKEHAFVWACFIAVTQVTSVVYKFLPFKSRIKPLSMAAMELSVLADEAERGWFDVAEGILTEREIHDKRFEIKRKKSKTMNSHFGGMILPEDEQLMRKANDQMVQYFNNQFPG